jgi:putative phosphoesterase
VHGGDIGAPDILERLAAIAPLTVVRGNNDTAPWAKSIPETARIDFGGVGILVIHDLKELGIDPAARGVRVVVSGHSHKPACVERGGVLYVNPGSAGRRRFTLPIAAGELLIDGGRVEARLVTLLP